jgi:peptide/nickel transport system ATP-binding protein
MYLGRAVESGPAEEIFSSPRHPYTRLLLETVPNVERPNWARQPMTGDAPSPIVPPPGCPFHRRCLHATDVCRVEPPQVTHRGAATVTCHRAAELTPS